MNNPLSTDLDILFVNKIEDGVINKVYSEVESSVWVMRTDVGTDIRRIHEEIIVALYSYIPNINDL